MGKAIDLLKKVFDSTMPKSANIRKSSAQESLNLLSSESRVILVN